MKTETETDQQLGGAKQRSTEQRATKFYQPSKWNCTTCPQKSSQWVTSRPETITFAIIIIIIIINGENGEGNRDESGVR